MVLPKRGLEKPLKRIASVTAYLERKKGGKNIGLLVDGPNMLRKEFNTNLEKLTKLLEEKIGRVRVGKVLLNQYAPEKLIEAITNHGLLPVVVAGDIDVYMAIEGMEMIHNENIDVIALATRDADFLPIIYKAKEVGKETIIIGAEPGFSVALQKAADIVIRADQLEEDNTDSNNRD